MPVPPLLPMSRALPPANETAPADWLTVPTADAALPASRLLLPRAYEPDSIDSVAGVLATAPTVIVPTVPVELPAKERVPPLIVVAPV